MSLLKSSWKTLSTSFADAILTISMNRPKANAMSTELLHELIEAFHQASNAKEVRGVLLRSHLNSTFSAGADLSTIYNLSLAGQQSAIDQYIFHALSDGITAPLYCSKPVACSLDGHTIAGGLMLALACDYIAIGTRKPFRMGITGSIVGVPFPLKIVRLAQHQLEPQLAYRLLIDAQLFSSSDIPIRCDRGAKPDDLARKWLQTIGDRPLKGFQITKKNWWSDYLHFDSLDNEQERTEYFPVVTSNECLHAMKTALTKANK